MNSIVQDIGLKDQFYNGCFCSSLIGALYDSEVCDRDKKFGAVLIAAPDNSKNADGENMIEREVKILCSECVKHNVTLNIEKYRKIWEEPGKLCESICKDIECEVKMKIIQQEMRLIKNDFEPPYYVMLAVLCDKNMEGYESLFGFVLKRILNKVNSLSELINFKEGRNEYERFLGGISKRWILLGEYVESFLAVNGLPEAELLTELSAARYEGSESKAKIYFTDEQLETVETLISNEEMRQIHKGNLRMIRKLMEISSRDSVFLYANKRENKDAFVVSKLVRKSDNMGKEQECNNLYLMFPGFMHWCVMRGDKELIGYYHGIYRVNYSSQNDTYIAEIDGLDISSKIKAMIKEMVKTLMDQKHGTSVILLDDEEEVNRLCKVYRGIRVGKEIKYNDSNEKRMEQYKEQLLSITGIDGAVFMNLEGECLAIGVLVDGQASEPGDISRGARYNSIKNYVIQKEKGKYIGLIFSEDGMVNVVSNCNKARTSYQKPGGGCSVSGKWEV